MALKQKISINRIETETNQTNEYLRLETRF